MTRKTIGRSDGNDLVLSYTGIAAHHADLELAADGTLTLSAADPDASIWLVRDRQRQRIQRAHLCLGDRFVFGEEEVPLPKLTGLFDAASGVRLRQRPELPATAAPKQTDRVRSIPQHGPRRNPDTGAIEE